MFKQDSKVFFFVPTINALIFQVFEFFTYLNSTEILVTVRIFSESFEIKEFLKTAKMSSASGPFRHTRHTFTFNHNRKMCFLQICPHSMLPQGLTRVT